MTDNDFCRIETSFSGEEIDKVEQLGMRKFTGSELKEYLEHAINTLDNSDREEICENLRLAQEHADIQGFKGQNEYDLFLREMIADYIWFEILKKPEQNPTPSIPKKRRYSAIVRVVLFNLVLLKIGILIFAGFYFISKITIHLWWLVPIICYLIIWIYLFNLTFCNGN